MTHPDGSPPAVPGLDALLLASLQDCPDAVLVRDDAQALSGRAFAALVARAAAQLRQCGLKPGERVLLAMSFDAACLVALVAALRAGLEPALVPCGGRPAEMAAQARGAGAVALIGPTRCGAWDLGEAYLSTAALCDAIRLVATLGPGIVDGAVDFSAAGLASAPGTEAAFGGEGATVLTFAPGMAVPVAHRQTALFTAALALVDQAEITPSRPLLSTLLPATLAGLVAGPFAAFIGAASLALHGPFETAAFLRALDAEPDAHLVAPAAMAPALEKAGILASGGSLILLSRFAAPDAYASPPPLHGSRPLVDLFAMGEATVASYRRAGGTAEVPAELFDGRAPPPLGAALNRARSAAAGG